MGLMSWEKTITCPYNPAHQITAERIQTHLVKCRRNHPDTDLVICPYNASHHVPKPEEQYHISSCPDRKIVELAKYSWALDKPGYHGNVKMPEPIVMPQSEIANLMMKDENWEEEATIKESYNPATKCSQSQVLRRLQGATPSERKKFYASEMQRHDMIQMKERNNEIKVAKDMSEINSAAFHTPRPSLMRASFAKGSIVQNEALRRPAAASSARSSIVVPRPGSVTSQLLAIINDSAARRPGSLLMGAAGVNITNSTLDTTTDADTTKDTLDTTTEDVDEKLNKLVLSRGYGTNVLSMPPLRRPSGLGSFIKK